MGSVLAARTPSLINSPGLTSIGGVAVGPPFFNENLPLRNQPPVINTVTGALAIQEYFDNSQWARLPSSAAAYAPHLRRAPLTGVPARPVLYQFALGDRNIPNPSTTAILRAGGLADRATLYRHDLAFAQDSTIPRDPHNYILGNTSANPLVAAIARGAQEQIATFFASGGVTVIYPEPAQFFETPIQGPLPEDFGFIL